MTENRLTHKNSDSSPSTLAAERMRRHRERRRLGLKCITIQLRAKELDVLIVNSRAITTPGGVIFASKSDPC